MRPWLCKKREVRIYYPHKEDKKVWCKPQVQTGNSRSPVLKKLRDRGVPVHQAVSEEDLKRRHKKSTPGEKPRGGKK